MYIEYTKADTVINLCPLFRALNEPSEKIENINNHGKI